MTRKLTPDQLDEIEEAAKKATPGEWRVDGDQIEAGEFGEVVIPGPVLCGSYCYGGSSTIDGDNLAADFAHIAMMDPATALALVAEVRELRAKVERVRAEVDAGVQRAQHRPGESRPDVIRRSMSRAITGRIIKALGEEA